MIDGSVDEYPPGSLMVGPGVPEPPAVIVSWAHSRSERRLVKHL
jgi:hypothetical protein